MTLLATRLSQPDMTGLTDAEAAAVLNAPEPALLLRRVDVATADAREILLSSGEWAAVVMAADDPVVPQQVRGACIVLRDTITETALIRATVPGVYNAVDGLLGGMVAAGVLTQGTMGLLMGLADRAQSWAEANEIEVTARSVGLARGSV